MYNEQYLQNCVALTSNTQTIETIYLSNWELLILKNIISNVSCTVNGLGFYEIFCLINHIDEKSV